MKLYEAYCKRCNRQTISIYNGIQEDENERPTYHLLTCNSCNNTFSIPIDGLEALLEFKEEKEK